MSVFAGAPSVAVVPGISQGRAVNHCANFECFLSLRSPNLQNLRLFHNFEDIYFLEKVD